MNSLSRATRLEDVHVIGADPGKTTGLARLYDGVLTTVAVPSRDVSETVEAWLAKSQANMGNVKSVTLSNGRELSGGSSIADPNANEPKSSDTKSTASR